MRPIAPGAAKMLFRPRLGLSEELNAKVALGKDNVAMVSWTTDDNGKKHVELRLERAIEVISQMPGREQVDNGVVDRLSLAC